ncbi:hypothetical protein JCM6882_006963 [Rhodosporidiobolus microsporus]
MGKPLSQRLRLSYAVTKPFSLRATFLLVLAWFGTLCGLVLFNFFTQAKRENCTPLASSEYSEESCQPTPLNFYGTYYTKPVHQSGSGTIGTFPWQTQGFGDNDGPIDYSVVSMNWTANPLKCAMVDQTLVLHLDSDSSTTSTCYYCGPNLRLLCTAVDSERTSIPAQSAADYQALLSQYFILFTKLHTVATTAFEGATVGSLQMVRHVKLDSLASGVLPWDESSMSVSLGTTFGAIPISTNDTSSSVASIASSALALSDYIETVTSRDLQPDEGDATSSARTLLVNYICKSCEKVYKPWREIFAVILSSTTALLSALFAFYKLVAENAVDDGKYPCAHACSGSSTPGSSTGLMQQHSQHQGAVLNAPSLSQKPSYQSTNSSHGAPQYAPLQYAP